MIIVIIRINPNGDTVSGGSNIYSSFMFKSCFCDVSLSLASATAWQVQAL